MARAFPPPSPDPAAPRTAAARRLLAALAVLGAATAGAGLPEPVTHVYKRVDALEIKADVYAPATGPRPRPVVVYLHGGSLVGGGRQKLDRREDLAERFLAAGYAVVSVDYRLAPETRLPGLVADVEDAFRWVRERGPELFAADPGRVAAWGSSAGGYLAFLTGFRVTPRPRVLLVEFGYADIVGRWQTEPSRHADHHRHPATTREEAWRVVAGPPIANSRDRAGDISVFNGYVRRHGEWPRAITGWDPVTEAEKFLPYLPVRQVTADYPPTYILHGREDTDIPYAVAEQMAAELARHGVEHRLVGIPGGEHGYAGADPAVVAAGLREGEAFVRRQLDRNR